MVRKGWKLLLLLVFLFLLSMLLVSCGSEQVEDVGELVLQSAGITGCG